jgi:hypothetical protein
MGFLCATWRIKQKTCAFYVAVSLDKAASLVLSCLQYPHNKELVMRYIVPVAVFIAVQLWGFGAFANPLEPEPTEIFLTYAYVFGTLGAIVYKMSVGSAKHIVGRTFRLRVLLMPVMWSVVISVPLVFMIMPKFGRPTGVFSTDLIYAYLTTYAVIDMTADFYILSDIIRQAYKDAVDREEKENGDKAP